MALVGTEVGTEQAHTYTALKLPVLQYSARQLYAQVQHLCGSIDESQVAHCTRPYTTLILNCIYRLAYSMHQAEHIINLMLAQNMLRIWLVSDMQKDELTQAIERESWLLHMLAAC